MAGESSEIQRGEYLPRVADGLLTQALQSSGAVQIKGPKGCGKTATAERQSASQVFMQDPDRSATLLALADTKPSLILRGEEPRLLGLNAGGFHRVGVLLGVSVGHLIEIEDGREVLFGFV